MKVYSAVKAIIKNKDTFLVLFQQIGDKKILDFPGGRIKHGENPYDALHREILEETTLTVNIKQTLGLWWFFRAKDNDQVVCTTFLCEIQSNTATTVDTTKNPDENENITFAWLTKS